MISHAKGTAVFIALGGGALGPEWELAWRHHLLEGYRSAFIHNIVNYVKGNDLDGVDMDLEWNYVDEHYSPFIIELSDSLKSYGLALRLPYQELIGI